MIGPHIINDKADVELLKKWHPPVVLLLDPNLDYLSKIREVLPNSKIIVRIYIPDHEVSSGILRNPSEYAEYVNDLTLTTYRSVLNKVDYFQVANEVCQHVPELNKLVEFELVRMKLADKNNYKCGIFAFSVGNPDLPVWSNELLPALKYANNNGHIVLVHQYSKPPSLWTPDPDWHIHRLEHKVLPIISQLGLNSLQFAVTEYGMDDLLYGNGTPGGWQKFISADEYVQQLTDISNYLYSYSDKVLGYCVFTLGSNNPWQTYDINGEVANKLSEYNYVLPKWRTHKTMDKKMRVIANAGLNVRAQPNATSAIIDRLQYNTIINVEPFNNEWAKYAGGYVSTSWLTDDLSILTDNIITKFAKDNNIDPYLLQALVNIESGGNGFINGRLLIRVEAHLLIQWEPKLNQFFTYDPNDKYGKQYFRNQLYHGNQNKEWEAFDFARSRNKDVAYRATSYGKYQILGDNYSELGFSTPEHLFVFLSASEENQDKVFLKYLEVFNLVKPLQDKDFKLITEKYNGPGNVAHYSKLLEDNYNYLKPKGEEVEVTPVTDNEYNQLLNKINELEKHTTTAIRQLIEALQLQKASISALQQQINNVSEFTVTLSKVIEGLGPDQEPPPEQIPTATNISNSLKPFVNKGVVKINNGDEYIVKDIFTTSSGKWDVDNSKFSIEQQFRDKYLKSMSDPKYLNKGGADHSIGFVVEDENGNRLEGVEVKFNSATIEDKRYTDKKGHGDFPMWSGQNMDVGRPGPWTITVGDASVSGLGLYQNWHISIWVVFQKL